jgi:AbrB family looped-hinge helix DNA binding protein
MQTRAKITSKGQVTIPRAVRRAMGLKEGDNVVFEETEKGFNISPARGTSHFAKYRGIGNPGLESGRDAVLKATREIRGRDEDE